MQVFVNKVPPFILYKVNYREDEEVLLIRRHAKGTHVARGIASIINSQVRNLP